MKLADNSNKKSATLKKKKKIQSPEWKKDINKRSNQNNKQKKKLNKQDSRFYLREQKSSFRDKIFFGISLLPGEEKRGVPRTLIRH